MNACPVLDHPCRACALNLLLGVPTLGLTVSTVDTVTWTNTSFQPERSPAPLEFHFDQ